MLRQRPAPHRNVGAVACVALLVVVTAGCGSSDVHIDTPALTGADAAACASLVEALPDAVSDQTRRATDPEDAHGAAWGDPAIVLRCGVPKPAGFDKFATCQVTNDVGWFVPDEQIDDPSADVVMTTIGFEQNVEVTVPASYRPPAAAMVDLADAIKESIRERRPCV